MNIYSNMKVYKIRNKETGEFSTGGAVPSWSKNGKVWTAKDNALKHIKRVWIDCVWARYKKNKSLESLQFKEQIEVAEKAYDFVSKCELIEYQVVEHKITNVIDEI